MVRKQSDNTSKNLEGAGRFNKMTSFVKSKMKSLRKNKQPNAPLEQPLTTSVPPSRLQRLQARRSPTGYQQIPNQNSDKKYNYMIYLLQNISKYFPKKGFTNFGNKIYNDTFIKYFEKARNQGIDFDNALATFKRKNDFYQDIGTFYGNLLNAILRNEVNFNEVKNFIPPEFQSLNNQIKNYKTAKTIYSNEINKYAKDLLKNKTPLDQIMGKIQEKFGQKITRGLEKQIKEQYRENLANLKFTNQELQNFQKLLNEKARNVPRFNDEKERILLRRLGKYFNGENQLALSMYYQKLLRHYSNQKVSNQNKISQNGQKITFGQLMGFVLTKVKHQMIKLVDKIKTTETIKNKIKNLIKTKIENRIKEINNIPPQTDLHKGKWFQDDTYNPRFLTYNNNDNWASWNNTASQSRWPNNNSNSGNQRIDPSWFNSGINAQQEWTRAEVKNPEQKNNLSRRRKNINQKLTQFGLTNKEKQEFLSNNKNYNMNNEQLQREVQQFKTKKSFQKRINPKENF